VSNGYRPQTERGVQSVGESVAGGSYYILMSVNSSLDYYPFFAPYFIKILQQFITPHLLHTVKCDLYFVYDKHIRSVEGQILS